MAAQSTWKRRAMIPWIHCKFDMVKFQEATVQLICHFILQVSLRLAVRRSLQEHTENSYHRRQRKNVVPTCSAGKLVTSGILCSKNERAQNRRVRPAANCNPPAEFCMCAQVVYFQATVDCFLICIWCRVFWGKFIFESPTGLTPLSHDHVVVVTWRCGALGLYADLTKRTCSFWCLGINQKGSCKREGIRRLLLCGYLTWIDLVSGEIHSGKILLHRPGFSQWDLGRHSPGRISSNRRPGRRLQSHTGRPYGSHSRVLQETRHQKTPLQTGLQPIHGTEHGDLQLPRRSQEMGGNRQFWNFPTRDVAAHGIARRCQCHRMGTFSGTTNDDQIWNWQHTRTFRTKSQLTNGLWQPHMSVGEILNDNATCIRFLIYSGVIFHHLLHNIIACLYHNKKRAWSTKAISM